MKILHTRNTSYTNSVATDMDHMSDLFMHGLVMLGHEVTDAPKLWSVYQGFGTEGKMGPSNVPIEQLHGMGFTLTKNVPDETHIDRSDIEGMIRNRYFDLVIIARADFGSPYEELIFQHYSPKEIIILCGKDHFDFTSIRDHRYLVGKGTYFKRELIYNEPGMFPMSCSFPRQKIIHPSGIEKTQTWSGAKPVFGDNRAASGAYKFRTEKEYYEEYARSYFGDSHRKYPWWEYERHYEIIASGAIPHIPELRDCPPTCLITMPKQELLAVNQLIQEHGADWFTHGEGLDLYLVLQEKIFEHFLAHCTTEAVAQYVLDTHANYVK